ncbi:MAG: TonB family protein [Proteobacteria bacterium]|nr:TonB family protein [Pseudomonadota bacterium]
MSVLAIASMPWIHALGWALLHFLWQGLAIGALYAALRHCFGSPAARHAFGLGCLIAMLACAVLTFCLAWPAVVAPDDLVGTAVATVSTASATGDSILDRFARVEHLLPVGVAIWFAGVCVIALRSLRQWRCLAAVSARALALSPEWQQKLDILRERFGVLRPVRLLASVEVAAPMLVGCLKPVILFPASLICGFPPEQIEWILAHELAHVRRRDYLVNLAQIVVETLLFYHPVVHWISADVRQQREQCCDDLALRIGGGERLAYARSLAQLEEWLQGQPNPRAEFATPAVAAAGGVLFARIHRIVEPLDGQRLKTVREGGLSAPVLVAATGLLLALLRLNSVALEAASTAFVRASASTAELLAAATVRLRVETMLPIGPMPRIELASSTATPVREAPVSPQSTGEEAVVSAKMAVIDLPIRTSPLIVAINRPAMTRAAFDSPDVAASADAATSSPAPISAPQPAYPSDALDRGISGSVVLDFRIDDGGHVRDIRVRTAHPQGTFEQSAIAALKQWRFPAATATNAQFTRNFSFVAASVPACQEITGSHICRRSGPESVAN